MAGVTLVSFAIEPWHIMQNICGAFHPSRMAAAWLTLGVGVPVGIIAGIVSPAVARGLLPADGARILHHGMPDRDGIGMLRR